MQSLDLEQIRLTLTKIAAEAEGEFKTFIDAIVRHNAVDTYLNTFVEGLKNILQMKKVFYILSLCKQYNCNR